MKDQKNNNILIKQFSEYTLSHFAKAEYDLTFTGVNRAITFDYITISLNH